MAKNFDSAMEKPRTQLQLQDRIDELEHQLAQMIQQTELFPGYLSGLSHDIRTPLNAIIGFSGLLEESDVTKDDRILYTRMITRSSRKLLTLISNLIDLAKLETGTLSLISKPVFLPDLIEDLEDEMLEEQKIYNKEHLTLRLNKPDNGTSLIVADHARLYQILKICFDNSLKYTDQGKIELSVTSCDDNHTCFRLKDTGRGMDAETLEQLFNLFSSDQMVPGNKMKTRGLAIMVAHRLAEFMQGELRVMSQLGKGTTVLLTLPKS